MATNKSPSCLSCCCSLSRISTIIAPAMEESLVDVDPQKVNPRLDTTGSAGTPSKLSYCRYTDGLLLSLRISTRTSCPPRETYVFSALSTGSAKKVLRYVSASATPVSPRSRHPPNCAQTATRTLLLFFMPLFLFPSTPSLFFVLHSTTWDPRALMAG